MKKPEPSDDQNLLDRIAAGDADAFRQIFQVYSPKVNGFALKLTRSRTEAWVQWRRTGFPELTYQPALTPCS